MNNTIPRSFDEFVRLAAAVAEILPGEWRLKPAESAWNVQLEDPSTLASLSFRSEEWQDAKRIRISSRLPRDSKGDEPYVGLKYGQPMPSITVSGAKEASQIAREIERRLIPEYLPLLEKARDVIAKTDEYHRTTEDVAQQIARLVGVEIGKGGKKVDFYRSPYPIFTETLSGAEVHGDDVELTLRLGHVDALALLRRLIGA
jgi:hypothetical protein